MGLSLVHQLTEVGSHPANTYNLKTFYLKVQAEDFFRVVFVESIGCHPISESPGSPAEVCILVHCMARLELLWPPLEASQHDLLRSMLEYLCPEGQPKRLMLGHAESRNRPIGSNRYTFVMHKKCVLYIYIYVYTCIYVVETLAMNTKATFEQRVAQGNSGSLRKSCSLDHVILLLHALAKLLLLPPKAYWLHLQQRLDAHQVTWQRHNLFGLVMYPKTHQFSTSCLNVFLCFFGLGTIQRLLVLLKHLSPAFSHRSRLVQRPMSARMRCVSLWRPASWTTSLRASEPW